METNQIHLKNEKEIAGIRKSCHLLADMFSFIIPLVKPGISTKAIDNLCRHFILQRGGKPAWYRENFPGAVCVSINNEVIHGVPSKKRIIYDGDIVSLDVGIDLDGYISDSTHTIMVGNVRPKWRELVKVTRECLCAGIAACVAGKRISNITNAVYKIASSHRYGVVSEYCGHGVGFDVHEDPVVPNSPSHGPNPRIQPGMVLAIEPMINIGGSDVKTAPNAWTVVTTDGGASAHEEHTVAVFADHTEVLTSLDYKDGV